MLKNKELLLKKMQKTKEILKHLQEKIEHIDGIEKFIVPQTNPKYKTIQNIYFKCLGVPYLAIFLLGFINSGGLNEMFTFLFIGFATFSLSGLYIAKTLIDNLPPTEVYNFFLKRNDDVKNFTFIGENLYEITTENGFYLVELEENEILSCIDKNKNSLL